MKKTENIIDLKGVCYSYMDIVALEDVNLRVNRGDKIAVLGANGSGKSTFLKILNGLIFPTKGSYSAFGKEVTEKVFFDEKNEFDFRRKMGFVFQDSDVQLFSSTVEDEVAFAPLNLGMGEVEIRERVDEALGVLGIRHLRSRVPHRLSGGEKKKVAIASILSYRPDVWLFDEPTTGLDPRSQDVLVDFISKLDSKKNTVVIATHDLEVARRIADRVVLMSEGHGIVEDDKAERVLGDKKLLLRNNLV